MQSAHFLLSILVCVSCVDDAGTPNPLMSPVSRVEVGLTDGSTIKWTPEQVADSLQYGCVCACVCVDVVRLRIAIVLRCP